MQNIDFLMQIHDRLLENGADVDKFGIKVGYAERAPLVGLSEHAVDCMLENAMERGFYLCFYRDELFFLNIGNNFDPASENFKIKNFNLTNFIEPIGRAFLQLPQKEKSNGGDRQSKIS